MVSNHSIFKNKWVFRDFQQVSKKDDSLYSTIKHDIIDGGIIYQGVRHYDPIIIAIIYIITEMLIDRFA